MTTVPGTIASAGGDYQATSGMATFPPGTTEHTVAVPLMGDGINEPAESFGFGLSNPVHANRDLFSPHVRLHTYFSLQLNKTAAR